jgi:hypothetical protein
MLKTFQERHLVFSGLAVRRHQEVMNPSGTPLVLGKRVLELYQRSQNYLCDLCVRVISF